MKIEQIYTGCLAQGAYYIVSQGEAAIIDPLRESEPYLQRIREDGATLKYIFETHFHADFVSGHLTLAKATGAPIVFGPKATTAFEAITATDGQVFALGDSTITALHTPGHTLESTTYLVRDSEGKAHAIFSGDTLFLGDVGRPDLAQKSDLTQEDLASMLYDSLRKKIMPLPDDVIVYPAHGSGSACGKHMMKETIDTLGNQKKTNYALREDMTKSEFIREVTEGLLPPPSYFPTNVAMNREGYEDMDRVLDQGTKALTPEQFEQIANQYNALILDVRHQNTYANSHIPRSVFIGLDGSFAPWVGALIGDPQQPILLVVPEGKEEEAVTRLSRVGFDRTLGYLEGEIAAWKKSGRETDTVSSIDASDFLKIQEEKPFVLDVRKASEYESGHLPQAVLAPLSEINSHLGGLPDDRTMYVHCAGGYRSMIASSILKSRGIHNIVNIEGGYNAILSVSD